LARRAETLEGLYLSVDGHRRPGRSQHRVRTQEPPVEQLDESLVVVSVVGEHELLQFRVGGADVRRTVPE
jgi:hypothetical protein